MAVKIYELGHQQAGQSCFIQNHAALTQTFR